MNDFSSCCIDRESEFRRTLARSSERLAQASKREGWVAARQGALPVPNEAFADLLVRLQRSRLLPDKAADVCHHLRRLGNLAIHENKGTPAQALSCLKPARELGVWLHRTFTPDPTFSPLPFIPPEVPRDISAELAAQVEALRAKLIASEGAAAAAPRS